MRQQLDRLFQHVAPGSQQFGDDAGGYTAFGHFDGAFDHRQHEPLDAVAIATKVPALCRQQPFAHVGGFGIVGQKTRKPVLGQPEIHLVLPKRVIGIKSDGVKRRIRHDETPIVSADLAIVGRLPLFGKAI